MDEAAGRLFVINADPEIRNSVEALASSFSVPCEAFSTAKAFLQRFTNTLAGCLIADLSRSEMSGPELQDALVERGSFLPIIFLSAVPDLATVVRAMEHGALTVIPLPFRSEELAEAVHRGLRIDRESRELAAQRAEVRRRLESLTAQERRVLEMIIDGTPNKRITRVFGVSQRTVARVRARIYEKMCVESAFELARVIANSGALPAVDGQERFSIKEREFRTHLAGDLAYGVSSEDDGRPAIPPPPHFQHDQLRMLSRTFERKQP